MSIRDMVSRNSDFNETKDFIPTPPYATRALYRHVSPDLAEGAEGMSVWDPAAGEGHMLGVFKDQCHEPIFGTDLYNHGAGFPALDFTSRKAVDDFVFVRGKPWAIITNPPYKCMMDFILNGLDATDRFLALLTRVQVLESQKRYTRVYEKAPPTTIGIFSDRIPFKTGVVVQKAPKMFTHIWVVWDKERMGANRDDTRTIWIPPNAQQTLERKSDYE